MGRVLWEAWVHLLLLAEESTAASMGYKLRKNKSTIDSPSSTMKKNMNNTHSNILRLLRTAKDMTAVPGINGSPHAALEYSHSGRDSAIYDIQEQPAQFGGPSHRLQVSTTLPTGGQHVQRLHQ
ncbi:hypothetical protein fugu_008548 [Takifugu bimaculatus]|uniref:Glutamate [NMDA] receptor epsilon subunit C-terminal domain-containing protein n=1 Tax=Takifugu bimaculatus TaxID=433685 RepID=A0A4Z2B282_9TELE|nr:hypothetical protein fugu_008548 [Takifugu bimaculatus]